VKFRLERRAPGDTVWYDAGLARGRWGAVVDDWRSSRLQGLQDGGAEEADLECDAELELVEGSHNGDRGRDREDGDSKEERWMCFSSPAKSWGAGDSAVFTGRRC